MRGIYKDLIVMLHGNDLIDDNQLKMKTEISFFGDRMIDILPLENDRIFRQAREYHTNHYLIQYLFTTRVMKSDIETALLELCTASEFPDVLLINSCLWDMTRYSRAYEGSIPPDVNRQAAIERSSLEEFLERISMLIRRLRLTMPATTQVIWVNMPWPLPVDTRSIVNRADNADTRHLNRMLIVDANFRASQLFRAAGYDVLDVGFYLRNHALYAYRVYRRIRAAVLREIKERDPKRYEALRSDIRTMRLCKLLDENPGVEERLTLEGSWRLDEMMKSFPEIANCIGKIAPQIITVLVSEDAVANLTNRKRKHSPDRT
ncbi:hypothetical protein NECAME_04819 [Necator americanus]|uniref:Uncharacterized protein n=1 Tax=Necator americanus TaxID=51031 RepID=W2SPP2_NECAM|nr:hypothetical protein NECAME_04819 [Necator americanus]ETN70806.1 hypothetical protein NECAME_04819 [Necator americanus]